MTAWILICKITLIYILFFQV